LLEFFAVPNQLPILFLSGMAADERLFASQVATFPELRVVPWVPPADHESLTQYAARLARIVDPGVPCIVGGASFGGVVALEMAPHLQARACLLIGSVRSPKGIPWRWRLLRPLAWFGPEWLGRLGASAAFMGRPLVSRGTIRRLERLSRANSGFERWAICAILRWRPSPEIRKVKVYQIHGSADSVLPARRSEDVEIVPGGPHALTLFASKYVNAFIERAIREVRCDRSTQA